METLDLNETHTDGYTLETLRQESPRMELRTSEMRAVHEAPEIAYVYRELWSDGRIAVCTQITWEPDVEHSRASAYLLWPDADDPHWIEAPRVDVVLYTKGWHARLRATTVYVEPAEARKLSKDIRRIVTLHTGIQF